MPFAVDLSQDQRVRFLLVALGVIPWIPAAPPPTPHPALAPPCTRAHLQIHSLGETGATGWLVGGVVLRNLGARCSLIGRPTIIVTPSVHVQETGLIPGHTMSQERQPEELPPRYSLRSIPTGGHVFFGYWWTNWCHASFPRLTVRLPGGDTFAIPRSSPYPPRCDDVASPPSKTVLEMEVGRFVQFDPLPPRRTHLPFTLRFPRLAYRGAAGSLLRYEVIIRNVDKRSYIFHRCPAYQETLSGEHPTAEEHMLNCGAARTFAPGQARVFAMRIRVPRDAVGQREALGVELGLGTRDPVSTGLRWAYVTIS